MYELIYDSDVIRAVIEKEFPDAAFKDASDCVHPERFEVTFDDGSEEFEDRFYVFAIRKGFANSCFVFQLMLKRPNPSEKQKAKITRICEKAGILKKNKDFS